MIGPALSGVKQPEPNLDSSPRPSGVTHPEPNREASPIPSGVNDPEPSLEPCHAPSGVNDPDPSLEPHLRVEKCSKPKILGVSPLGKGNSRVGGLSGNGVEVPEVENADPGDMSWPPGLPGYC